MMSVMASSASNGSSGPRPSMSLTSMSTSACCSTEFSWILFSPRISETISAICRVNSSCASCEAAPMSMRSMSTGWTFCLARSMLCMLAPEPSAMLIVIFVSPSLGFSLAASLAAATALSASSPFAPPFARLSPTAPAGVEPDLPAGLVFSSFVFCAAGGGLAGSLGAEAAGASKLVVSSFFWSSTTGG